MFTLEPGEFVHINKGRLHAFRKDEPLPHVSTLASVPSHPIPSPFLTRIPVLFCRYSVEWGGRGVGFQWGILAKYPLQGMVKHVSPYLDSTSISTVVCLESCSRFVAKSNILLDPRLRTQFVVLEAFAKKNLLRRYLEHEKL